MASARLEWHEFTIGGAEQISADRRSPTVYPALRQWRRHRSPIMPKQEMLAFFVFAITAAVTPGPSNALVLSAGARSGLFGGLRCLFGVVAGMALMMAAAVVGLGGAIAAMPTLLVTLKWAGSALLLWLAWKVATAPRGCSQPALEPIGFWEALTFQWINPKSWIVSASAAASYSAALGDSLLTRALSVAVTFAVAATIACMVWLVFGAGLKQWLKAERNARFFNLAMGMLLGASVIMIHL